MINFQIINSIIEMKGEGFFLIPDSWDDWFEYEISYTLWINNDSESKRIGRVKIAEKNQSSRTLSFYQLPSVKMRIAESLRQL